MCQETFDRKKDADARQTEIKTELRAEPGFSEQLGKVEGLTNIRNRGLIPTLIAAGIVDQKGRAKYTGLHSLRHFSGVHVAPSKSPTVAAAGASWREASKAAGLERSTLEQIGSTWICTSSR